MRTARIASRRADHSRTACMRRGWSRNGNKRAAIITPRMTCSVIHARRKMRMKGLVSLTVSLHASAGKAARPACNPSRDGNGDGLRSPERGVEALLEALADLGTRETMVLAAAMGDLKRPQQRRETAC